MSAQVLRCGVYLISIPENSRKLIFGVPIRASLSDTDGPIPAAIQGCLNYIEENSMLTIVVCCIV